MCFSWFLEQNHAISGICSAKILFLSVFFHVFDTDMLFLSAFFHFFHSNLPTPPSVNWKICLVFGLWLQTMRKHIINHTCMEPSLTK